jgi:D-inositol-3-phosphate glycosyltransferase
VRAAALISAEFPTLRVILAGSAVREYQDYPESLRRLARELGLEERLELPGFVEDIVSVLERLSVFVSATYRDPEGFGLEGLGAGVVEASWAGVPVVAAAGGGVHEAMRDGETGTIVAAPEPGLLAEAVGTYLRDPELAIRVGDAGARFVRDAGVAPAEAAHRLFSCLRRAAAS